MTATKCQICNQDVKSLIGHNRDYHTQKLECCGRTLFRKNGVFSCIACPHKEANYTRMQNHLRRAHKSNPVCGTGTGRVAESGRVTKPGSITSNPRRVVKAAGRVTEKSTSAPPGSNDPQPVDVEMTPASPCTTAALPPFDPDDDFAMDLDFREIPNDVMDGLCGPSSDELTLEKGKGREVPLPSPGPSCRLPSPPLPVLPDTSLELRAPDEASGLPSALAATAPEDPETMLIPIPYGHPDIVTSTELNMLNCIVYKPLRLLICTICKIAITPGNIRAHRRRAHEDSPPTMQRLLDSLVVHNLRTEDQIEVEGTDLQAVPGIPYQPGYRCSTQSCSHGRASFDKMQRHSRSVHNQKYVHTPAQVQRIFDSNGTYYPVIIPPSSTHHPPTQPSSLAIAEEQYHAVQGVQPELENRAHLNPFLARYEFVEITRPWTPHQLQDWVALPRGNDEPKLFGLEPAVRKYYKSIVGELGKMDRCTTVLRWIKSTKTEISNKPFKVPMREKTTTRYVCTMTKLIAFVLRGHLGLLGTYDPELSPSISEKAEQLLLVLSNGEDTSNATHQLIMAILSEIRVLGSPIKCPVYFFIAFSSVEISGKFRNAGDICSTISEIKWPLRATVFWEIFRRSADPTRQEDEESMIQDARRVIREDSLYPFAAIQEMGRLASSLAANSAQMPRMIWEDDHGESLSFDGRQITMTSFRQMYTKLLQDTKEMMLSEVLLGLELPDLQQDRIVDNLSNEDIGYSFIMDKQNNFHNHLMFLARAMLSNEKLGSRFCYGCNDGGIVWNQKEVRSWLKTAETCLGNLFACAHYGSGQPARGTELATLALVNTAHHARSFYWFRGYLNIITTYNKTQTNLDKPRVISRSLPPPVGELFIQWMTFVVPALVIIASSLADKATASNFNQNFFTSLSGSWDTDDFSSVLGSISGESTGKHGLGHSMGMADTRHFLIIIMRRHLLGTSNASLLEDYFNEQSGHGSDAAENYAISFDTIKRVSEQHLSRFVEISKCQHKFLFPTPGPIPHVSAALALGGDSAGIPQLDYQQLARALGPIIAPQIATLMKPGMEQNVAEAFAAIIPIHQPPSPSLLPPLPKETDPPESQLGVHVVDPERVEIAPERYAELRAVVGGKDASFLSVEQACATELAARRQHDLVVVAGTSGGKSMVFMAAAFNEAERNAGIATVVILPLVALIEDMSLRLKASGIKFVRWGSDAVKHYETRIILVSADVAASPGFVAYFAEGCRQKKIGRAVIDEAHFYITVTHYRPLLQQVKALRAVEVPFVLLTATLPPAGTEKLLEAFHFIPSSTRLIRAPTHRPEIVYSHFQLTGKHTDDKVEYLDGDGKASNMISYVKRILANSGPDARAIIFCLTVADAIFIAQMFQCQSHHSQLPDEVRRSNFADWKKGTFPVLSTTSCLGAGVDCSSVVLVVHYKKPRTIIDYAQESGRGGRKLHRAWSTVFSNPRSQDLPLEDGQSNLGVEEMTAWVAATRCRRTILGIFLDGISKTCLSLGAVALCDLCERKVPSAQIFQAGQSLSERIHAALQSNSSKQAAAGHKGALILDPPPSQALQVDLPLSTPDNIHHSVVGFTSPFVGDTEQPSTANASMPIQIAAARARNESNRAAVQAYDTASIIGQLNAVKAKIGHENFCGPCWIEGRSPDHVHRLCENMAREWVLTQSSYRTWRRGIAMPKNHCFFCFLPQLFNLHENITRPNRCELGDFVGRILYAAWNQEAWKNLLRGWFNLTAINSEKEFGQWLKGPSEENNDFLRMHQAVLRIYLEMADRTPRNN